MKKIFEIIRHEYITQVRRKGFWIGIFSIPLMLIFSSGISFLAVFIGVDRTPVAYVDYSGVLSNPVYPEPQGFMGESFEFIAYADTDSARQALFDGTVQGYFVIAQDYQQNSRVEYFTPDLSYDMVVGDFADFMQFNLLQAYPEDIQTRFMEGSDITVRALENTQKLQLDQWWNIALPVVTAILLFILIQVGGSYILQSMVAEKENRMMEILITAVTPTELMIGKTIGNLGVAITMLLVWGLCGGAVLLFLPAYALAQVSINWGVQIISIVLFLETLIMMACLMMMAGVMATDARDAGQLTWFFGLVMSIPFIVITTIIFDPNGSLSTFFSIFPFTAFFVMPVRMTFTLVPWWQIALTIVLLAGMIALSVWLATRAMKRGMLSFSKKLKYSDLFKNGRTA